MDLILWRHAEAHDHPDLVNGQQGDPLDLAPLPCPWSGPPRAACDNAFAMNHTYVLTLSCQDLSLIHI